MALAWGASLECDEPFRHRRSEWGMLVAPVSGFMSAMIGGGPWRIAPGHALWVPRHSVIASANPQGEKRDEETEDSCEAGLSALALSPLGSPKPRDSGAKALVLAVHPLLSEWHEYRLIGCEPLLKQLLFALAESGGVYSFDEKGATRLRAALDRLEESWSIALTPRVPRYNLTYDAGRLLRDFGPDSPSVDSIAARLGTSERTLRRRFREDLGVTPEGWRRKVRLTEAIRLLFLGERLEEIAARCGYRSRATLTRAFLLAFGMTPPQYRRVYGADAFRN